MNWIAKKTLENDTESIDHRFVTCLKLGKETFILLHLRLAEQNQEDQLPTLPLHMPKDDCSNKMRSPRRSASVFRCKTLASRKRSHHHGNLPSLLSLLLGGCKERVSQMSKIYFAVYAGKRHTDHRADLTSAILPFRSFSTRMTSLLGLLSRSTYSTISLSGRRSLYSTIS